MEILAANRKHASDASEEDSDIVLTALELTDDLSGILKGILDKLNKLDTIERSVKKIEGSLVKLEERTTKLEALEKTAREDIDNLKANHAIIEKKQDDTKDALDKKIKGLDGKIAELADKERKISQTLDDLNTKDLYLEAYSRRENIKFNKIKESSIHSNESENTEEVLRFFLEKQLGYQNARSLEIQRVHRLGKEERRWRRTAYSSKISSFQGLRRDLALGSRLKGTNFQIFRDLPQELVTRRSKQMNTFKKAKRNNIPVSFRKWQPDKFYVRGKLWPVGQVLEIKWNQPNHIFDKLSYLKLNHQFIFRLRSLEFWERGEFLFCCRLSRYRAEQSSFCVSVCCFSVIFCFFCYLLPMPPLSRHPYCSSLYLMFFLLRSSLLLVLSGSKDELLFHVDMLILKS